MSDKTSEIVSSANVQQVLHNQRCKSSVAATLFILAASLVLGSLSEAVASDGYACNDKPCAQARIQYVERWVSRACSISQSLDSSLSRKERMVHSRANLVARLNQCRRRARRGRANCSRFLQQVVRMDRQLSSLQRQIDRLVARLQSSCSASLPNGAPGVPPTCEENEASNYCPVNDEQQALQSIQQRCADLRAEKGRHVFCNGNCIDPAIAAEIGGVSEPLDPPLPPCVPTIEAPV